MKRALLALLPVLLLTAPAAGQKQALPTWYAQAMAHSTGGLNVTHFWSKGARLRAETVVSGHRVVTIVNGPTYYAYDALQGAGVAIERAERAVAKDAPGRRPFGRELPILLEQGAEKVRSERRLGASVDVYRVTDDHGKREVWVTQGPQPLPVRLEMYSRKSGTTRFTDYLNWLSGLPIPDSYFEPDPKIELQRFSFDDYVRISATEGPVGPVPVLYADLLHGGRN